MQVWYQMSGKEVLRVLGSSECGLTERKAEEIRKTSGPNRLTERKQKKAWQIFLGQFQDLLVILLLAAAVISMLSGNGESTLVIFAVLIMNAVLGTIQYEKARKTLDSLKSLSSPESQVIRGGEKRRIPSVEVVPGDILVLEAGDVAAADGRILECCRLLVDESSLTGESEAVEKCEAPLREIHPLAEQKNMIFSGSLIMGGRGQMVVTATGMDTEIGRIADLMNEAGEKKTPLQISLDRFSRQLALVILGICLLVFCLNLYRRMAVPEALMFAVALAVAAIPEALGSIVTIVQAMGTQKMAKEHAIIKDLKAVENLGCVSVICSDKTGTLTQNRMRVQQVWAEGKNPVPHGLDLNHPVQRMLVYISVLDNNAWAEASNMAPAGSRSGDPTELALLEMGRQCGIDVTKLQRELPREDELPFDSVRKRMSTINRIEGRRYLLTKGAVDEILEGSTGLLTAAGVRPMTGAFRQQILAQSRKWSGEGLRVLAMACRILEEESAVSGVQERDLTFVGMTALQDPPRPESQGAVLSAGRAGIRTVMITGDHKGTAVAIARRLGMFSGEALAVSGQELDQMSGEELNRGLERIRVYARVSPEHKLRIVEAWQRRGQVVAMTGDGVNDSPALKKADVGIAMGMAGTQVSRDAASMILTDDNFATIMKAVANGRNVYRNIRHAIQFLLSGNMAGIICVLYTSLRGLPMPFAPVHLLFINLLTDSLPAIAIGMEPQEAELLNHPPRDPSERILNRTLAGRILLQGALIAACTMTGYHMGMETGGAGSASTMAFAILTLARLFHGFNCRSEKSLLRLGFGGNLWSVMAFEAGVLLLAAVLFLPGLQVMFAAADLNLSQLQAIAVLAFLPTLMIQAGKILREMLHWSIS